MIQREIGGEEAATVRFFHICTDGTNNGVIHFTEKDYNQAVKISAVCAYANGVKIIDYCHMSTHSHFVVWTDSYEKAKCFADSYKKRYSQYLSRHHGLKNALSGVKCSPIEICDVLYLKKCIAYVLLNAVAAGIVKYPEDYKWSSFNAYFQDSDARGADVAGLGTVRTRTVFTTRCNLSASGYKVDENGNLEIRSLVDYAFVERLFGTKSEFYKTLNYTDSIAEEGKYVCHTVRYDDTELFAELVEMASRRYRKTDIRQLTKKEKISLAIPLQKKTGVTLKRIARILRLNPIEVAAMTGGK